MRSVYLVGTDHRYQRGFALGVDAKVFDEFRTMLRDIISRCGVRGIAEEMSLDGLSVYDTSGSIGFHLAAELGLSHRYCDPDAATRNALAISSPQDRERHWLEQLRTFDGFPALFVLGSTHIESFKSLLTQAGIQTFVEQHDWEPSSSSQPAVSCTAAHSAASALK